jgi:hypothetical protein
MPIFQSRVAGQRHFRYPSPAVCLEMPGFEMIAFSPMHGFSRRGGSTAVLPHRALAARSDR